MGERLIFMTADRAWKAACLRNADRLSQFDRTLTLDNGTVVRVGEVLVHLSDDMDKHHIVVLVTGVGEKKFLGKERLIKVWTRERDFLIGVHCATGPRSTQTGRCRGRSDN